MTEESECDSCGNAIIEGTPPRLPEPLLIDIPREEANTYEAREFLLCSECRRKIVDWVEDCPEDEVRVDPVGLGRMVSGLERHASEVERLSEELSELQSANEGDSDGE